MCMFTQGHNETSTELVYLIMLEFKFSCLRFHLDSTMLIENLKSAQSKGL